MKRTMHCVRALLATLLITGRIAAGARAQDAVADAGVFDLGEIVITTPETLKTEVTTVNEITAKDIKISGAQTAAEAIENTAGVRLSAGGRKGEGQIYLRGFAQDQIRIMLDGIPLEAPYFNEVDLSQIPVENIAKITVTKGASSAMYGADAMGGVINIVTRKPAEKAGALILGYGEYGETTTGVRWGDNLGRWYYSVSGRTSRSDGYGLPSSFIPMAQEDGGRRINSDFDRKSMSMLLGASRKNEEYAINLNLIDNERGSPVETSTTGYLNRFTTWKKWTVDLSGEQWFSGKAQLREKFCYHKYDNTLTAYTNTTFSAIKNLTATTDPDISTYDDYSWGARLLYDRNINDSTLWKTGVNYNKDVHEEEPSPGYVRSSYETDTLSLGMELQKTLNASLTITAGASYDVLSQVSGNEALTSTSTVPVTTAGDQSMLSPMLGMNYRFNDKNSVYASLARKTSFPTQRELFTGRGAGSTSRNVGNTALEPEKSSSWELGYDTEAPCGMRLRTAVFHNNVTNYITTVRVGAKNYYVNLSKVVLKGLDTQMSGTWGPKAQWTVGHTYLKAYDASASGTQLDRRPRNKTDLGLGYDFNRFVSANLNGTYFGAYKDSGACMGRYFILNAGITARRDDKHTTLRLNVENVFDRLYSEENGYPMPGRTLRLEMQYDF